jgi:hypothetical protein
MPPSLKFYDKFWDDYEALDGDVQDALTTFLGQSQKNPNSVELLAKCERDGKERWCRQFHDNYVVFWKFERGYEGNITDIQGGILKIDVLAISPLSEISQDLLKRLLKKFQQP